jgi:hypothetical protein
MSEIQLLKGLHTDLLKFFDYLIEAFPQQGDIVIVRFALADQYPITDVMEYIINSLLPLKDKVDNRDNNFFLENNILFDELDNNKVNHFKRMWKSDDLDAEDRESIWRWFDRFLLRASRYKKCKSVVTV